VGAVVVTDDVVVDVVVVVTVDVVVLVSLSATALPRSAWQHSTAKRAPVRHIIVG
jgi:hypothetical protein